MVSKKKYFIEPKLQLIEQKNCITLDFPNSEVNIKEGVLYWYGKVKPTAFSKEYLLKMEYRMGNYPKMWLIGEKLEEKSAHLIPHHYSVDLEAGTIELCLFKPKMKEWMKHYSLSQTIIPWAVEWLYYYEIWQITGEWKGGGDHPSLKDCKNSTRYREKIEMQT